MSRHLLESARERSQSKCFVRGGGCDKKHITLGNLQYIVYTIYCIVVYVYIYVYVFLYCMYVYMFLNCIVVYTVYTNSILCYILYIVYAIVKCNT